MLLNINGVNHTSVSTPGIIYWGHSQAQRKIRDRDSAYDAYHGPRQVSWPLLWMRHVMGHKEGH